MPTAPLLSGREDECWPGVQLGQYWPRVATVLDQHVAWYLTVYFGSKAANLLVDSGAQVTMMSKAMYDRLAPSYLLHLNPMKWPINVTNGGLLRLSGNHLWESHICHRVR